MSTTTLLNPAASAALAAFADAATSPENRRAALTTLINAKVLPKYADNSAITLGRHHLLQQATDATIPEHRLLAIAESVRLIQVVKRWMSETFSKLRPAFADPLPELQLLVDADDRLNLARACGQMLAVWLPGYLAHSIANEETGEKARAELVRALLSQSPNLSEAIRHLATAFSSMRPTTEFPGDTIARRLSRTFSALRETIVETEIETGDALGDSLYELVAIPLSRSKPQDDKARLDLVREVLLTVHELIRTRISVVTDPKMYRAVEYGRKLSGGSTWPSTLAKPLDRLISDVKEALLLLGRQGQRDQVLLAQLEVLVNYPERARTIAHELAIRHAELPEEVRDWLQTGRIRVMRQASESALEVAASTADESIGLALQEARRARTLRDAIHETLLSNLDVYDPALAPLARDLLDRVQALAVQLEQAASLRGLSLYGAPGEEIEMSSKYFILTEGQPRKRMRVRQPAVVRMRADGGVGDVVTKGIVE